MVYPSRRFPSTWARTRNRKRKNGVQVNEEEDPREKHRDMQDVLLRSGRMPESDVREITPEWTNNIHPVGGMCILSMVWII